MRGMVAGLVFLAAASGTKAADLGALGEPAPPAYGAAAPAEAIVVPACEEGRSAILMRCVPRREVFDPRDTELIRIERSMGRPPVLPYKQLFTWP